VRTSIATLSPALAAIGTGSNPPAMTAVVTELVLRGLRIVAVAPSGIVPGGSETYARSLVALPTTEKLARELAADRIGTGSDTIAE